MAPLLKHISQNNFFSNDPRPSFALLLGGFLIVGMIFLGFNRSLEQAVFMILLSCGLDLILGYFLKKKTFKRMPYSACITGIGLSILTHYGHIIWLGALPVILAIFSKYLITYKNEHVFNPGLFGIVMCLLFSDGLISTAPVYQWGASIYTGFYIATLALLIFVYKIKRTVLISSFLGLYILQLILRGVFIQTDLPFSMLLSGIYFSPAFYLFAFFMITDPKTSPATAKGQFSMALTIVVVDLLLHYFDITRSLFYAGFIYFLGRWMYLHVKFTPKAQWLENLGRKKYPAIMMATFLFLGIGFYQTAVIGTWQTGHALTVPFALEKVDHDISGHPSKILSEVDPRAQHVAKWFYSFGDVILTSDVDNDGYTDIFVTQPLKHSGDRAQLYLNRGNFKFERFDWPDLTPLREQPEVHGSPVGGVFFDHDNDGDKDLIIVTLWGQPWLLENTLIETGQLGFKFNNVFDRKMNSGAVNVADLTGNGLLDVVVANIMPRFLPDYQPPENFNLFQLPQAIDEDDKRPLNIMRRNPFNAENGGVNFIYQNKGQGIFEAWNALPPETRWTFDAGLADLNQDGWPDLYFANTAGPDRLYLNHNGESFHPVMGASAHQVGRDTYRGMNVSFIDIDKNGLMDVYVSNMHKSELPEGSLLWRNNGLLNQQLSSALRDDAFNVGLYNHDRFGWGAGIGDLDMDGDEDLLQANGWLDDVYDTVDTEKCGSYIYKLFQVEQTPEDIHGYADNWPDLRGRCLYNKDSKRAFLNHEGKFHDISKQLNWDQDKKTSRGIAVADLDNDGDLDVLVSHMTSPISIYRNELVGGKSWIGLKLIGDGVTCNTDAIGTIVHYSGIQKQVFARNGLAAQNDIRLLFPKSDKKHKVDINWCGRFKNIETIEISNGGYHVIKQQK